MKRRLRAGSVGAHGPLVSVCLERGVPALCGGFQEQSMEQLPQGARAELLQQRLDRERRRLRRGESPDDPDDAPLASRRPRRAAAAAAPPQGESQSTSDEDSSSDHGLDSDPEFETTSGAKSTRRRGGAKPAGPLSSEINFPPFQSPNLDRGDRVVAVDVTREGLMALLHESIELNNEVERIGKEAGAYGLLESSCSNTGKTIWLSSAYVST